MAKIKLGVAKCDHCGEQIVWREADSGSLSYTCQHCDYRAYAPSHSDAAKGIAKRLAPVADPVAAAPAKAPAKAAKAVPVADPVPAPPVVDAVAAGAGIWAHLVGAK